MMAKQKSRRSELTSGRSAPGMFKGNGPDRKTSVAQHLRAAASGTSTRKLNDIRGPSGQDGNFKMGGANDRSSGGFDGARTMHGGTK
jgi:hypothetical protein